MAWVRYGSLIMCLGVMLGAFGAHGLKKTLTPDMLQVYQTGVFYHLIHGLALLAVGWMATLKPHAGLVRTSGWLFVLGIVIFSGSLYALSLTGIKRFGMITPLGGLSFIVGWICLAASTR